MDVEVLRSLHNLLLHIEITLEKDHASTVNEILIIIIFRFLFILLE